MDPEEMLQRARQGDSGALGELLESYRSYFELLARLQLDQQLPGKVDPGDLVQEAFLQVHRKLSDFAGESEPEFLTWMRQILASRVSKQLRKFYGTQLRDVRLERRLHQSFDRSSQQLADSLVSPGTSPSERAIKRERAVMLADELSKLKPEYQDVIILRNIQGLSFREVAERMGKSVDSVDKLWVRALAALRSALGA